MKIKSVLLSFLSFAALLTLPTACEDEEGPSGAPSIELSESKLDFDVNGETKTVELTATRDWKVDIPSGVDWISVNPKSGKGGNKPVIVEISVLSNKVNDVVGGERRATLKFDIGFDSKELAISQKGEDIQYTPIRDVRAVGSGNTVGDDVVVCGVVVSNKDMNNLTSRKAVIIQDETAGIYLFLASDAGFARGDKISVNLSGELVSDYGGLLQMAGPVGGDGKTTGLSNDKVTLISSDNEIAAKTVSADDFFANKYESQYVAIADVQVQDGDLKKTWVQNDNHSNINVVEKSGNKFVVRSSKYSNFKDETVPQGAGVIKGIGSIFNSTIQLVFSDPDDYKGLTGERFTVGGGGEEIPGGMGDGTKASPYNVVKVLNILNAGRQTDAEVYVKGKISSLKDNKGADGFGGTQYGNYTYHISDDGTSANEFMVFRGYYLNGEKFTSADQLKVGDEVLVLGKLIDYNGTFEMNSGSKIMSLNGKETGEVKDPVGATIAEFLAAAETSEQPYRLTGVIERITSDTYGNFNLTDETGTVYVYGLTRTDLGYGAANDQSFASIGLKTGDKVTLVGFRSSYNGTPQVKSAYYVSHEAGTSGFLSLSNRTLDVSASATSATFTIYSNVSWNIASDNTDYTVTPASGNGEAEVTVNFPANTGDAKTVTITVSTDADIWNKTQTVVITHKKQASEGDSNSLNISIADNQNWVKGSDGTYGSGYELSKNDYKLAYYKYESTSDPIAPSPDHIRVYKSSVLSIVPPTGRKIKKVLLTCTGADRCADMTVLTDSNAVAKASTADKTIVWTGSVTTFVAQAAAAQVRIKEIAVELE